MVVIYSPDGTNVYGSSGGEFKDRAVYGVESCKIMFLGALPIHLFRHFCRKMYRLVTCTASQTDGKTDSQTTE